MADPLSGLLQALALTDTGARTDEDIFTGPSQWTPIGRVFGGQVLAQSLVAGMRTIEEGRIVHSMHGYFLRPGDITLPITFSVDRIHDGRSFSTRRTQAYQAGQPILSMIASFQDADAGLEHQVDIDIAEYPSPDELPAAAELLEGIDDPRAVGWAAQRAFDIRHIDPPVYLHPAARRTSRQAVWMRLVGRIGDDENLHRAALAYGSDYTILEPTMRAHGIAWSTPGLKAASLDHAMWFHRFAWADEWLLYVQEAPNAIGGRGLSTARMYDRRGRLIASVAQEGMLRVPAS
ncbi:MAG: acyl-CoA thioesterase II [Micrococcales bacterium]|nr:acyl-CoA thioesterase II [Micrococcales bacterium]